VHAVDITYVWYRGCKRAGMAKVLVGGARRQRIYLTVDNILAKLLDVTGRFGIFYSLSKIVSISGINQ
jgi:hypothetical protein